MFVRTENTKQKIGNLVRTGRESGQWDLIDLAVLKGAPEACFSGECLEENGMLFSSNAALMIHADKPSHCA